jgi:hypothetical protein
MRLVHRDQAALGPPQKSQCRTRGQPLGRHVEQLQAAVIDGGEDLFRLFLGISRSQCARLNPRRPERTDLIPHQRDERRDDNCHPIAAECRKLKAQRLAAPCGHDGQRVATCEHSLDDLGLTGTEVRKAEDRMQQLGGLFHATFARSQRKAATLFRRMICKA